MKRTSKMTLTYFLYMLTAILGICGVIFQLTTFFFRIGVVILAIVSIVLVLKLSYYPHCGKLGIKFNPF